MARANQRFKMFQTINVWMIYQLFNSYLKPQDIDTVLQCFGTDLVHLNGFSFTVQDLAGRDTLKKMRAIVPLLNQYYLQNKAKLYLLDLNSTRRCIVILRQILKTIGYRLVVSCRRKLLPYTLVRADHFRSTNGLVVQRGIFYLTF